MDSNIPVQWELIASELRRFVSEVEATEEFTPPENEALRTLGQFSHGVSEQLLKAIQIIEAAQKVADAVRSYENLNITFEERSSRSDVLDSARALVALLPAKEQS